MWLLPFLILVTAVALSIPLGRYLAWIMDGRLPRRRACCAWFEQRLDTGPQDWKQYAVALLLFNAAIFVFGFVVLALQPLMPLNPDGRGMLAPTTIFNTVSSFLTNTNLQHYSGEQHLSYFSQIFFVIWNMFVSAAGRPLRAGGDHPRAARRRDRGQLLRRHVAGAWSTCSCRSPSIVGRPVPASRACR